MNVIVLEHVPSSQRGGKELSLLDICRGLHAAGHHIHFLHLANGDLLETYRQFCCQTLPIRHPRFDFKAGLSSVGQTLQEVWRVYRQLRQAIPTPTPNNTLIYLDQDRGSVFVTLLSKLLGCPVVFHLRQPPFAALPQQEQLAFKAMRQFIAVSQQTRQDWSQLGIPLAKIKVIHNGTDPSRFLPASDKAAVKALWKLPKDMPVIAYLGRLDREKGIEGLIHAFGEVCNQCNYPVQLLLAGKPVCHPSQAAAAAYLDHLKQLCESLGVAEQVHFLGHVANTAAVYQASTVTVLPSLMSEPFGKTVIESLACGVPVVASRTGGIPEILTGEFADWLVSPGDVIALAAKLHALLGWKTQTPELSDRCRAHVLNNFTIQHTVAQVCTLLEGVAEGKVTPWQTAR